MTKKPRRQPPKYLTHREVKPAEWRDIWNKTAPQARQETPIHTNGVHKHGGRKD